MNWWKTGTLLMASLALVLAASCASAQDTDAAFDEKGLFDALDDSADNRICHDEYCKIWKDKKAADENFRRLDKNGDGFLTRDEFRMPGVPVLRW